MILEANDLTKTYRRDGREPIKVLDAVSLRLAAGDFAAIEGASGSGKSTLLLICGGLLSPDAGSVEINGKTLTGLSAEQSAALRARHIGFVFQRFHLLPYLTVEQNIRAAAIAAPEAEESGRVAELMARFEIAHRANHLPGELSVGERQRTALARALLTRPSLILADEPTGNLDPENADIVLDALTNFASDGGAVLMVTHNREAASRAPIRRRMKNGSIMG